MLVPALVVDSSLVWSRRRQHFVHSPSLGQAPACRQHYSPSLLVMVVFSRPVRFKFLPLPVLPTSASACNCGLPPAVIVPAHRHRHRHRHIQLPLVDTPSLHDFGFITFVRTSLAPLLSPPSILTSPSPSSRPVPSRRPRRFIPNLNIDTSDLKISFENPPLSWRRIASFNLWVYAGFVVYLAGRFVSPNRLVSGVFVADRKCKRLRCTCITT
ncbi:hypothetical protein MSAN_00492200 [Mycena sanguinolenta]|uniref:Uncharacterized protein n=1 Tax=Mycena sanguinolenta TaxID=230812 RepID=A0A8H6ZAQ5_9AGAR|nr:hypothetical protein MSAN_00492200 [Mycena sanguinolenta]